MKYLSMLFLTMGSLQGFAALSPFHQSCREIEMILQDPRMEEYLGPSEVIESISRNATGYLVCANGKQVQIDLHYLPQKRLGPAPFELSFPQKGS